MKKEKCYADCSFGEDIEEGFIYWEYIKNVANKAGVTYVYFT